MNRGSPQEQGWQVQCPHRPSMRPRFMNRGSAIRGIAKQHALAPFNEAPIHESGKWTEGPAGTAGNPRPLQ